VTESTTEHDAVTGQGGEPGSSQVADVIDLAGQARPPATGGADEDRAEVTADPVETVAAQVAADPSGTDPAESPAPQATSDRADPAGGERADADGPAEPDGPGDDSAGEDEPVSGEALLVQEGEIAGDYLEQLLDILDYDGDIDLDVEGGRAIVAIVGTNDLDPLVGARGATLDALQELTRLTVAQQTGVRTRLMLDVGGYRASRRTELGELAASTVARVIDGGETVRMTPMNAFERKIVHDVVTATDGVRSESEGEDPGRRVVILPDR